MPPSDAPPPKSELTRDDVIKVALLARLRLSEDEITQMADDLGRIVHYIEQLVEVDTEGIEPMVHALPRANVLAEDVPRESFDRERILSNAPSRDETCYLVPAVLGD